MSSDDLAGEVQAWVDANWDTSITVREWWLRLAEAGYARLEQLTHVTEAELGQLHGMGPKALRLLREALGVTGRGFEASEPRSCVRVLTDPRTASLE